MLLIGHLPAWPWPSPVGLVLQEGWKHIRSVHKGSPRAGYRAWHTNCWNEGWVDGKWLNAWMEGRWMDEQTDGQMSGQKDRWESREHKAKDKRFTDYGLSRN